MGNYIVNKERSLITFLQQQVQNDINQVQVLAYVQCVCLVLLMQAQYTECSLCEVMPSAWYKRMLRELEILNAAASNSSLGGKEAHTRKYNDTS